MAFKRRVCPDKLDSRWWGMSHRHRLIGAGVKSPGGAANKKRGAEHSGKPQGIRRDMHQEVELGVNRWLGIVRTIKLLKTTFPTWVVITMADTYLLAIRATGVEAARS